MPLDAAEPWLEDAVDAVADTTTQLEYVYLLRVVEQLPNANIPMMLLPAAAPYPELEVAAPPALTTSPE